MEVRTDYMVDAAHENAVNTAEYWLARAESVRAAASATQDVRVRRHLLGSAEGYEKVARNVAAEATNADQPNGVSR